MPLTAARKIQIFALGLRQVKGQTFPSSISGPGIQSERCRYIKSPSTAQLYQVIQASPATGELHPQQKARNPTHTRATVTC